MKKHLLPVLILIFLAGTVAGAQQTLLEGPELEKVLPKSQYEEGDNFPVQARNAGGVRLSSGKRVLAALVDTSGFSSQAQSKYLGMLILEQPVELSTSRVPAGAYGWGKHENSVRLYDVGGNSVASTRWLRDEGIAPVKPLQVALRHGGIRIYAGKEYFVLWPISGR